MLVCPAHSVSFREKGRKLIHCSLNSAVAAAVGDDTLSSSKEAETAVYKIFEKHIQAFVMSGEDEPVLDELFQPGCVDEAC
jgi:hypothetical protein